LLWGLFRLLLNYPITSDHSKLARMILSRLNWESISYEKHCQTALMVLRAVDQEPLYINVSVSFKISKFISGLNFSGDGKQFYA